MDLMAVPCMRNAVLVSARDDPVRLGVGVSDGDGSPHDSRFPRKQEAMTDGPNGEEIAVCQIDLNSTSCGRPGIAHRCPYGAIREAHQLEL